VAIKDTTRKPYIEDNDENIFIGIDLPFRKSNGIEGYFASTSTTIEAVKNNIRNLVNTHQGERFMQPQLGMNLRKYLFEQFTDEAVFSIQNDIVDTFKKWLPFVEIQDIQVNMSNSNDSIGKNTMNITIVFNITQDPNTLESVSIEIGE
jgi:phage baseplate assembly protein W|tara:strand:- start:2082 stop:2528 length:447 start_codon:yes stop_codon:yes gene_type:complete